MASETLSLREARRIALAAQGLDRPRAAGPVGARQVRQVIRRLGLVQLDYVNVLVPAHYLVIFSRLGPYDRTLLDGAVYQQKQPRGRRAPEFTEQWAHEASIVPVQIWPLLRHRMEEHRVRPYGFEKFLAQHPNYVQAVLDEVRARGPIGAEDLSQLGNASGVAPKLRAIIPGAWVGTVARAVLEAHFGRGLVAVAGRQPNFARTFDLAERLIPSPHYGRRLDRAEAERGLLLLAARAHGIGTGHDLADYYRMAIGKARPRLAELAEAGELREVKVEGWREPAYVHPGAGRPIHTDTPKEGHGPGWRDGAGVAALLAPFDPLVWHRPRIARLFNFDYRLEIFVPETKRKWGYYVLPFLFGDRLAARVDLKADRTGKRGGRLLVLAAYLEPAAKPGPVAEALASELCALAGWLGLGSVVTGEHGDFMPALSSALRSRRLIARSAQRGC